MKKKADYVLAVKGNQETLHKDLIDYFNENDFKKDIKSVGIIEKTINKKDKETKEIRYYISSLAPYIELFSKSVREHWKIEIMHWHLDVTFKEDSNKTIEETANKNMNIIRKWALSILKLLDIGKKMSLKLKRFAICSNPTNHISNIMKI